MECKEPEVKGSTGWRYGCRCERCRAAANVNKQRHYEKRRQMLNEIKLASGCVDCGYREHPEALEFDHVRGVKKFPLGAANKLRAWDQVLAEIDKCEVRCANCHRIKTMSRRRATG